MTICLVKALQKIRHCEADSSSAEAISIKEIFKIDCFPERSGQAVVPSRKDDPAWDCLPELDSGTYQIVAEINSA
ncbi:hypothetical protein EV200_102508 [Pedobacter psychrotolerans]|uniref:Uncharacterized protein n=1 Tax=Pedobacter psychrotolerans TaxID=1843235 RepID=A0A4R2HKN3_9SPHI|nr:hypothetical protein [Pedobacter psychrotolerans]TCO29088.1 hypothetical protein EV200_102508 [Pedobacter psychrotolerans]GGE54068.1 hypothetical protein GCM10011413_20540 [Pedobacter psychrotolerans]